MFDQLLVNWKSTDNLEMWLRKGVRVKTEVGLAGCDVPRICTGYSVFQHVYYWLIIILSVGKILIHAFLLTYGTKHFNFLLVYRLQSLPTTSQSDFQTSVSTLTLQTHPTAAVSILNELSHLYLNIKILNPWSQMFSSLYPFLVL